jgi:hypothetical protein
MKYLNIYATPQRAREIRAEPALATRWQIPIGKNRDRR